MRVKELKEIFNLTNVILFFAAIQFVWLVWYFYTGFGGPQELVALVRLPDPQADAGGGL